MESKITFTNWQIIRYGSHIILRCGPLRCQNVSQEPLEAFEFEAGADVKSPHGSPDSNGEIRFVVLSPVLELVDEDGFSGIDGAGLDKLRSPSRSMFDKTLFALVAGIQLPRKFR